MREEAGTLVSDDMDANKVGPTVTDKMTVQTS